MEIPDEMLKEITESGYDQDLVFTQIRKLLDSDKPIKENEYNLELMTITYYTKIHKNYLKMLLR